MLRNLPSNPMPSNGESTLGSVLCNLSIRMVLWLCRFLSARSREGGSRLLVLRDLFKDGGLV